MYNLQDLIDACHKFLDSHAGELKLDGGFNNLSQVSFFNLLILNLICLSGHKCLSSFMVTVVAITVKNSFFLNTKFLVNRYYAV